MSPDSVVVVAAAVACMCLGLVLALAIWGAGQLRGRELRQLSDSNLNHI